MRCVLQVVIVAALAPNVFAKPPPTLMTVVTPDWKATTGELRRWQRDGTAWRQVGVAVPVVVGNAGMKWPGDKREGDGASPAGRFRLGGATGYERDFETKLSYRQATDSLVCIDDPTSRYYGVVMERPPTGNDSEFPTYGGERPAPWDSDEKMRRNDAQYRYTIFVRHNDAHAPGKGSCIFLHVWASPSTPTTGCTAMALDDMRALLQWATPATELVQLPRDEYARRQRAWDLPPLGQRK